MKVRETFTSRLGVLATVIGVAVGLGNVWRFPYMVGRFGGAAFVVMYLLLALLIGVPALMGEWALGRATRRGSVGAFESAGVAGGRWIGWAFFLAVAAATAYYSNVIGWVLYHGLAEVAALVGVQMDASLILPPPTGFSGTSLGLQLLLTSLVVGGCAVVLTRGLRSGIQKVSTVLTPVLFVVLLLLIVRSLTLPGSVEGLRWFLLRFSWSDVDATVAIAALGQVIFSVALGGTFMVVYGSYMDRGEPLASYAAWTVAGDTAAGLLAGLAIFPAVFALGLAPDSGPGLLFATLPRVFEAMPLGRIAGVAFFLALGGAAYLSALAAFEVLVAGVTDNTRFDRKQATYFTSVLVLCFAVPPMLNMEVFVPWDLTFGTGFQTFGAMAAALTFGWALDRSTALGELAGEAASGRIVFLYWWIRLVIPLAIGAVGTWWLITEVLNSTG
jgi:NSS family neurotransmitter:Na+ symporter